MRGYIASLLLLVSTLSLHAGVTTVSSRLKGAYHAVSNPLGIQSTAVSYLQDDQYNYMVQNPSTWSNVFTNCNVENRVILRYEESTRVYYSTPWSLAVQCTLKRWSSAGTAITPDEYFTLTIDYDPAAGTKYNDKDVYVCSAPGYRTQLIVGTVTPSGAISSVPADVVLETEIEVQRSYIFSQLSAPASITNSGVLADHTLNVRWDFLPGAESYDLEFVHVSSYVPNAVANADFSRATRINTPDQNYTLQLAYDDGYVLYRVRGVGYNCDRSFRKEGVWSATSSALSVSDIDPYRNWQYSAAYAEDGKRKEVISFYDGTGKQRQAVTLSNTSGVALIGETMYDYEGRPAVQTLPAPEANRSSELRYYESFSLVHNTLAVYDRKVFDTDDLYNTNYCAFGLSPGMDTDQGASNYYSPDNTQAGNGMYQALPDAQLYPFVQTRYGPDGRPVKQGAPGPDHTVGSSHEVQTFYTTPTQQRLDRLFGNEVGYAEHYNQISTVDPNGQMSVSYLDLSGRVVATSLIGEAPDNLDALPSNTVTSLTESFNNNNVFDQSTGTWLVNAFYMVNTPGDYQFTYEMTPEEYVNLCTGDSFDCVYDLKLNIYDACDNPVSDNESPHVLGTPYTITYAPSTVFSKTFTVSFPSPGVYRVEKVLTLNQAALDAAVAAFVAALPGTCFQSLQEITDDLNAAIDSSECLGCDSACIVKGIALGLTGTALTDFIDSCQTHDCTDMEFESGTCAAMLNVFAGDLAPGGQYFDNVPAGTQGTANDTWLTTYVWGNGASGNWTNANFLDPSGNLITNWTDMRTYWQNGWATQTFTTPVSGNDQLVKFHPEYCHYTWCNNHEDDRQFDMDLFFSNDDAWASSYPSGTGNAWTYNPAGADEEGTNIVNADPYFNSSPGSGDKTAMQALVNVYSGTSSMWTYAGTLAGCTGCDAQWTTFRSLYISTKAQFSRARENTSCGFLCDSDVPLDFYANSCSGAETNGFMIRVPDLVNTLSTQPSSAWNTGAQSIVPCNTAATGEFIDLQYAPGASWGSYMNGCIEVLVGTTDITCGLACLNGFYTPEQAAAAVVAAINSCVSSPDDYTAALKASDPSQFYVIAPAYLGASANGTDVTVNFLGTSMGKFYFSEGVTDGDCPGAQHCLCNEINLYQSYYNTTNVNSPYAGGYIVDHSVYTSAAAYIAYVLNSSYGTSVDSSDVTNWLGNCDASNDEDPTDAGTDPLPAALDCENRTTPCMDDAYDITDYYAGFFYDQLIEQATQNFIAEYIAHCFGGNFAEDFNVEHDDREHHFTLYYYDQAGNLTRTVPPHAVQLLTGTTLTQVNTFRTLGTGSAQYPLHNRTNNNLVTNYKYNSFNNLTESATPDGGTTTYYYDLIGRIVASQNSKQAALPDYVYSYTFYDPQGRIYEVGQVTSSSQISSTVTATMSAWETFVAAGTREQVTSTYYDNAAITGIAAQFYTGQNFLRKRVVSVTIEKTFDNDPDTYDHATHFSYDVHGNVSELIQDYPDLADHAQQYKHICYAYDLISGNVHQVMYQHNPTTGTGKADQFFHQYYYDADNRLTNVYSSSDSIIWEQDQKYFYYLHGPLGRSETGDVKVQGTDYAYTIHGWIKGVNANTISSANDIGKDAQAVNNTSYSSRAGMHSNIGLDAYGYVLGYYWNATTGAKDWKPINASAQSLYADANTLTVTSNDLFNGNIKEMSTALSAPNGTSNPSLVPLIFNSYRYDQLNRIKSQTSYTGASTTSYAGLTSTGEYSNVFTYDAAGNISTQLRNGTTAAGQSMDDLDYYYYTSSGGTYTMSAGGGAPVNATNKLAYVDDMGTPGNYADDLEVQSAGNYEYDAIGNLTKDVSEQIDEIDWNVYGKISTITRDGSSSKSDLIFEYDAFGNRVGKIVKTRNGSGYKDQNEWLYTYYVRDASGNVMATYTRAFTLGDEGEVTDKLALSETHLYGASRIGIKDRESENIFSSVDKTYSTITNGEYIISGVSRVTPLPNPNLSTPERTLGYKQYEFTNHLGNVLVTASDRKVGADINTDGAIDYFTSDVVSYSDYSAFGAPMPARHGGNYRYSFNGKETDAESDLQDYGMRIYNPRLGKFLSVDPIKDQYPMLTPYQFASNTPIWAVDIDGLEGSVSNRPPNFYRPTNNRQVNRPSAPQRTEMHRVPLKYQPNNQLQRAPRPMQPSSLMHGDPHDGGYTNPTLPNSMAWFKLYDLGQNIITTNSGSNNSGNQNQSPQNTNYILLDISVTEYTINTVAQDGSILSSRTLLVVEGPGAKEFEAKQQKWQQTYDADVNAQVNKAMQDEYHQNNPNAPAVEQPKFTQQEIDTWKANNWTKVQMFKSIANFRLGPSPRDQLAEQVAQKKATGELKPVNTTNTVNGVIH